MNGGGRRRRERARSAGRRPDAPAGRPPGVRLLDRLRRHVRILRITTHPRYAIAHALAHLLPVFSAGTLNARLYRLGGIGVGPGSSIAGPLRVISGYPIGDRLRIGSGVVVSTDVVINLDERVTIGDRCSIGPFVRIYTATHGIGPGSQRMMHLMTGKPVTIEPGAWVGLGATVLPGVSIGAGAVVGAGSVVTRDVPANSYAEGNPAQVVRELPWGDR